MRLLQSDLSAAQQRERTAQNQSQESRRQRRAYEELRDINGELRRGLATAEAEVGKLGKKLAASQRRIRSLEAARHTREQRECLGGGSLAHSSRGIGDSMAASLGSASTVSLRSTASVSASQASSGAVKPKRAATAAVDAGLTQAALRVLTACLQSLELPELEQLDGPSQRKLPLSPMHRPVHTLLPMLSRSLTTPTPTNDQLLFLFLWGVKPRFSFGTGQTWSGSAGTSYPTWWCCSRRWAWCRKCSYRSCSSFCGRFGWRRGPQWPPHSPPRTAGLATKSSRRRLAARAAVRPGRAGWGPTAAGTAGSLHA